MWFVRVMHLSPTQVNCKDDNKKQNWAWMTQLDDIWIAISGLTFGKQNNNGMFPN